MLIKTLKAKRSFADNHVHNIWRIFESRANFAFPTSEVNRHYLYKLVYTTLTHELPNNLRLKTLGNIRNILKLHRIIAQFPISFLYFVYTNKKHLKNGK